MSVSTTYTITFGLFRGGDTPITEDEWNLFLVQSVCPFLDSFSVREELGFWKGEPEPCRVLTFISKDYEDSLKVHAIATHYKERFKQDAVLINSTSSITDLV